MRNFVSVGVVFLLVVGAVASCSQVVDFPDNAGKQRVIPDASASDTFTGPEAGPDTGPGKDTGSGSDATGVDVGQPDVGQPDVGQPDVGQPVDSGSVTDSGNSCCGVVCPTGEVCVEGQCVCDPCDPCCGVVCPEAEICFDGTCVCDGRPPSCDDGGSSCGDGKTLLCHYPPGNPGNEHTICVGDPAVLAHLAHGDTVGGCGNCTK